MPKVSSAHLDARRRGIIAAAQRCVARKGPAGTTMRDICRAANLSPGGVYRYFSGKSEILAALAAQRQGQVERFFRPLARRSQDTRQILAALEALITTLDDEAARDGLQVDMHLWSSALDSEPVHQAVTKGNHRLVEALAKHLPGDTAREREALARVLLALLQGLAIQKALDPQVELAHLVARARRALEAG